MSEAWLEQEVRRQAMLQVMGLEVWLPRQQLLHAAPTPDWLLDWQPAAATRPSNRQPVTASVTASVQPAVSAPPISASPDSVRASLQQVRQALEAGTLGTVPASEPEPTIQPTAATPATELAATLPAAEQTPAVAAEIPRFSLQLLCSGPCLLLADLPLGEAFQTSDPDFQLLRDILRAAGLPPPQLLRRGEPVRWPLLSGGALAGTQDAEAARACVRDLLEHEVGQQAVSFVWLLGPRAMRFANPADEDADLFTLTAFQGPVRLWNLPSLEQLMQERSFKPQLWYHLQKLMPHWASHG